MTEQVWKFELPPLAEVWILSPQAERFARVADALKRKGHLKQRHFASVEGLFAAIQTFAPAIIVCDAETMPEEGVDLAKDLRANPRLPNVPVVPIMNKAEWEKHGPVLNNYGISAVLIWPFTDEEVLGALSKQVHSFQKSSVERIIQEARDQFRAENFESAGSLFEQARSVRKTMTTEVGLASTLSAQGNLAAAQKVVNEAQKIDNDSFDLQLLGLGALVNMRLHTDRTVDLVVQGVKKILPLCSLEARALRVWELLAGRAETGLRAFEACQVEFARWPAVLFEVAKAFFQGEKEQHSLAIAKTAYEKGLRKTELLNLMGVLYRRRGESKIALMFYEEAIKAVPDDYRLHFNKGLCLEELRMIDEALEVYEECARRNPEFAKAKERVTALRKLARRTA